MNILRHSKRQQQSGTGAIALRMLLLSCVLLSQWRVPLPWLHQHDELAETRALPLQLQHCAIWHEQTLPDHGEWHFHFATLDEILRGAGCPVPAAGEPQSQTPLIIEHDVTTYQASSERDSVAQFAQQVLNSRSVDNSLLPADLRHSSCVAALCPPQTCRCRLTTLCIALC
jgi:hypothetical protein